MAVRDGGGKRTRFACLETARGVVATTVSVLTVAVVVMVTIAALRPVEFSLSIARGFDSNPTWWLNTTQSSSAAAAATTSPLAAAANASGEIHGGAAGLNTTTSSSSSSTWRIAEQVNLTFSLVANNPSGRKQIRIFSFTVRVLEMPRFPGFDGMRDIAAFPVPVQPFTLKRQTSHSVRRKFFLRDAGKLSYIAYKYGAEGTFDAMVLVDASISSGSGNSEIRNVTYYCWPVLVGWTAFHDSPPGGVTCTSRKELISTIDVDSMLPQPPPALMPAAG